MDKKELTLKQDSSPEETYWLRYFSRGFQLPFAITAASVKLAEKARLHIAHPVRNGGNCKEKISHRSFQKDNEEESKMRA